MRPQHPEVLRIEKGWIVSGMAFARILFVPMFIAMQRMSSEAWAQNGFLQIGAMAPRLNSSRIYFKMRMDRFEELQCLNLFVSVCLLCSPPFFLFPLTLLRLCTRLEVLMAFSNGYVSTLSMMLGPEQTGVSSHEKEPVGTIMYQGCKNDQKWLRNAPWRFT
jgi:hypothetical protein